MLEALAAGAVGLGAASFLVVGAAIGWFVRVPTGVVAGVMAFGAGALISTLAFELVAEAHAVGGLTATLIGFVGGAVIYVLADLALARQGARARKQSIALQSEPGVHAAPAAARARASGSPWPSGHCSTGCPRASCWGCRLRRAVW